MYECRCGHTFTVEKEVEHEGESMFVCPLCQNNDYWDLNHKRSKAERTPTDLMIKARMLYGVWFDYLNSGKIKNVYEIPLVHRHLARLERMRAHYLQQLTQ